MAIFASQPFKALYLLGAVGFELARLPLWLVKYLTSYGRQHPEWTFGQALGVRLLRSMVYHVASVQMKTPLPLTPGKESERFVVIEAADASSFQGPFAPTADIKPVAIGATWYPAPLTATSDTSQATVILHLHGGAYVIGDGRTLASGYMASLMLKHTPATHVFAPQYRLSTLPANATSNPFPAALQDCLTSYLYLINELKISPKNIVLSGDSAGGNAAIALLRYIVEYGSDLGIPQPAAAWLWSPWVEVREAVSAAALTNNSNYGTDYLSAPFTQWGSYAYAGPEGLKILDSPYVSQRDKPFKVDVPMFVNTGSGEVLYNDDVTWTENMKKEGNNVTLDVEANVPHDILLMGKQMGFHKEAVACAKRAGDWLKGIRQ